MKALSTIIAADPGILSRVFNMHVVMVIQTLSPSLIDSNIHAL